MFKHFFLIIVLGSFGCFLYGICNIFLEVEENYCRMTYMFGQPQFSRVQLKENADFPNYGLYFYYEGSYQKDVNRLDLKGAPVIFVPGNGGSYKQVRSLASVALRKGIDNAHKIHMDYFTIDYNEELSGLYGGYLEKQKYFLKKCITTVLSLYKNSQNSPRKVILIGHSMGGKVTQAILTETDVANLVNTIIFIASPLDRPVVNLDAEINAFYDKSMKYLTQNRIPHRVDNKTNVCCSLPTNTIANEETKGTSVLADVLLISIGGGNRDLLVHAGLTGSQFSDIHAMTSSIPKVWLSCDHLSSVWCLQLVLVINRFLFSISSIDASNYVLFNEDKTIRLHTAAGFFTKHKARPKILEVESKRSENEHIWSESAKRVYRHQFKNGLRQTFNQMIHLAKYEKFKKLYVEVINVDNNDWIYGCTAKSLASGKRVCERGTSLAHYIQNIPSDDQTRSLAILDLHNIKKTYSNWTHVVVRLPPSSKPLHLNYDIHDPTERSFQIKLPRWFSLKKKYLIEETVQGTLYYKLLIQDLDASFQGLQINIEPRACSVSSYHVTTKICVPWARGFERYHILRGNKANESIYVNVPIDSPQHYNTSINPVSVEIYLDPVCRYSISYQFSVADTMSRIVREFYHWLPSHLIAVLCIVLKNLISKFHTTKSLKWGTRPYTGFFQYTSLYIVTGARIFKKILMPMEMLPITDRGSIQVSIIVHSTAIAVSILASFGVWTLLTVNGNIFSKIAFRLSKLSFATSSILVSIMTTLPLTFGVLAVAIALSTCSGIALILSCVFYFLMISNAYRDYLEAWFWEKAKSLLEKTQSKDNVDNEEAGSSSKTDRTTQIAVDEKSSNSCEGLQNFPFHITMFLLLFLLAMLNVAVTIAWVKNYGNAHSLPDPALLPVLVVLGCLSLLLQLNVPHKLFGCRTVSILLYFCAAACVIYGQESVYRLNFITAFVFVLLLFQELFGRMWRLCVIKN